MADSIDLLPKCPYNPACKCNHIDDCKPCPIYEWHLRKELEAHAENIGD